VRQLLPQITPFLRLGWRWPDALRALSYRDFRLFFFGQLISLTGTWMQSTAQQWLVYRITGSQASLGWVTFASFLPVLLLSLFMGVIVDRLPRRRLLLGTQVWFLLLAAALSLLTATGLVTYAHILILSLLFGIGNALDMPARQAFHLDLVGRPDLMNAIALNSSVFNGARILGPLAGGVVIAVFGEAPAFAANAISYLAVIAGLLLMRPKAAPSSAPGRGGWDALKEGLVYLWTDRRVFGLVGGVALISLLAFPYLVLLPAVAKESLGLGPEGFGILMGATGVGALVGGLGLAFGGDHWHKGKLLVSSRAVLAVALVALGLARSLTIALPALALAGYAFITQLAVTNTLIQLLVPDALRGRVVSAFTWALGGFLPVGSLLLGVAGDQFGTSTAILIAAVGAAVLTVLAGLGFPNWRGLR
jgi:MFS family permease